MCEGKIFFFKEKNVKFIVIVGEETLDAAIKLILGKKFKMKASSKDVIVRKKRAGTNFGRGGIFPDHEFDWESNYCVRISGIYQYIENPCVPFNSIYYVQECFKRHKQIRFTLEAKFAKQDVIFSFFFL